MDIVSIILVVLGLCLFETVSSIDNAVVNADVLHTMSAKSRRWFLLWGLIIAVFVVRGLLPWLIVWLANVKLGPIGSLTATFSGKPEVLQAVEQSAPFLLLAGGTFLVFLFFHWLFLEPKKYGLPGERFISRQGVWFFAVVSVILCFLVWKALQVAPHMAFAATLGSTAFFIVYGFRMQSETAVSDLSSKKKGVMSDLAKLLYLEVLDATFSIDGVVGAFAFTMSVPLIILGNGLGALVVRQLTIKGIDKVQKYYFLKNGAMYSILFLGVVMLADAFGAKIPQWVTPVATFVIVGYFLLLSKRELNKIAALKILGGKNEK